MAELRLWQIGADWWASATEEGAWASALASYGSREDADPEGDGAKEVSLATKMTITDVDAPGGHRKETKTVREWLAGCSEGGMLCTTEW